MRGFVGAVVKVFPLTGDLHLLAVHQGAVYGLGKAKYSEGFILWHNKPLLKVHRNVPEWLVLGQEDVEEVEEGAEWRLKGFKVVESRVERRCYDVFSYAVVYEKPTYKYVEMDDYIGEIVCDVAVGCGEKYKYYSTPTWMYAVRKKLQALHPELHVKIQIGGKYRWIEVQRIVRIKAKRVKVANREVETPTVEVEGEKEEEEEFEISDPRLKALLSVLS